MRLLGLVGMGLCSVWAFGYSLEEIKAGGSDRLELSFGMKEVDTIAPAVKIDGNVVDLSFPSTTLGKGVSERSGKAAHPLLQRLTANEEPDHSSHVRLVLKGSAENLKDRIRLEKEDRLVRVLVDYAPGADRLSALKAAEEVPLGNLEAKSGTPEKGKSTGVLIALFVMVIGGAIATIFLLKVSRGAGKQKGSRKYLIEQLAYHSLGNRNGVSLLKVGDDFVLVGVTPNQISMLSNLPELKKRYEEESVYERENFKVAVEEELGKIRGRGRAGGLSA